MDLWQLITSDHANATHLCREIVGAVGGGVTSRERLLDELRSGLEQHITAERDTLYKAVEKHEPTRRLVDELRHEHAAIEAGLERLAGGGDMDSREWTQRFEDFSYLLDQHFYRVEHELLPAARRVLTPGELHGLQSAFARRKLAALRAEQGHAWRTAGMIVGALAGAAAVALAASAWRTSSRRGSQSASLGRGSASDMHQPAVRAPVMREPRPQERRLHLM